MAHFNQSAELTDSLRRFLPRNIAIVCCVSYGLFLFLAADVYWNGPFSQWDSQLSRGLHDWKTQDIVFFHWVTEFGDPGLLHKLTWGTAIGLLIWKRWYHVPGLMIAVFGGSAINNELQDIFGRGRPRFEDMTILPYFGFPSGHTASAAIFFGYTLAIIRSEFTDKLLKALLVLILSGIICLVGISRFTLLVHFPGDVVGALLWSACWVIVCYTGSKTAFYTSIPHLQFWIRSPSNSALALDGLTQEPSAQDILEIPENTTRH